MRDDRDKHEDTYGDTRLHAQCKGVQPTKSTLLLNTAEWRGAGERPQEREGVWREEGGGASEWRRH